MLGAVTSSAGTVRLDVHPPIRTTDRYEFHCEIRGVPLTLTTAARRVRAAARGVGSPFRDQLRFGFRAVNFRIAHHEVWDSVFPLMFLSRNGGPLFNRRHRTAVIRVHYPVLEPVRAFYVQRAASMGLDVTIEADTFDRTCDVAGSGRMQTFGGGKESRLLFGLLRELGRTPRVTTGGASHAPADLQSVEVSEPLWGALAERVMPALMSGAAEVYFGGSLGEAFHHRPWHQYYDMASPEGQREFNNLLHSLGVGVALEGPLVVLPANLVQAVLSARYPALAAHQASVPVEQRSEKNLHVALIKLHHGLPFEQHCSPALFASMARRFVDEKLARPDDFGFHNFREVFHREMMAILARQRSHPLLRGLGDRVPPDWDASWIDGIHTYVHPHVDAAMLEIFRAAAPEYVPTGEAFGAAASTHPAGRR